MSSYEGKPPIALVIAGAVAKGAFEAGVTSVLAQEGMRFDRFVGTSAGALNATLLAAGAAAGCPKYAAKKLEDLWRDEASLARFFQLEITLFKGFSGTRAVEALVRGALQDVLEHKGEECAPNEMTRLTLVTTDPRGTMYKDELTHEDEYKLTGKQLLDKNELDEIAQIATASAAFPVLFVPPTLKGGGGSTPGQRVDGGVVNNTAISYAIDDAVGTSHRNSIVVVTAAPNKVATAKTRSVFTLLPRLVEILINERISRDLVEAHDRNETRKELIRRLRPLSSGDDIETIVDELGFRHLDILPIRPADDLVGGAFGGFFFPSQRAAQIEKGKEAARHALALRPDFPSRPAPPPQITRRAAQA